MATTAGGPVTGPRDARALLAAARRGAGRARRSGPVRWAAVVVVALLGAWLGVLAAGTSTADVGPVEARLAVRPALQGETLLRVPPLGSVTLDTHAGPLRLDVQVVGVDPVAAQRIVQDPSRLTGIEARIVADVRDAVRALVVRVAVVAALGAALAVLLVLRRPRRALVGAGTTVAVLAASGGVAAATFDPRAIAQPRYEGLLTLAPTVVGSAEDIVADVGKYGQQLAQLVTNVTQLYDVASTLPAYAASDDTVRVLSVSDIHLNPVAFDVIASVSEQFQVDLIIDTGDLTDHGSSAEGRFAALVGDLGTPYVFIRGNHDSVTTEAAVEAQANTTVLREGQVVELAGLRIAGIGDPRFTPDKTTRDQDPAPTVEASGERLAESLRDAAEDGEPVDVALVHDPEAAAPLDGLVPLVLAGHGHEREVRALDGGTLLFEQGSTGGAGLRGLEGEDPTPIQLSVLYFDPATGDLQAWDDIDMGGLGLTSAEIDRHVVTEADEAEGSTVSTPGATPPAAPPAQTPAPAPAPR
ncbi:metallophosphoesterase family protein [Vallicoccus soli]|uniref:Calcineurin-like phosphoesterase domain-containing protein n=1 Tax=Vallicoccus soli TaxID=2339232 RepID=A0A3A3YR94_9ACTN|nr:metallophosphoesterase [Vallicoccus soli]RJK92762.1 hypothetical protein D5H78_17990 [Vallicoccus soli]